MRFWLRQSRAQSRYSAAMSGPGKVMFSIVQCWRSSVLYCDGTVRRGVASVWQCDVKSCIVTAKHCGVESCIVVAKCCQVMSSKGEAKSGEVSCR